MKRSVLVLGAVERDAKAAMVSVCATEYDAKPQEARKVAERRSVEWYPPADTSAGWAIPDTPRLRAMLDKRGVGFEVASIDTPDHPAFREPPEDGKR
jgi:hypothetical protein